MLLNEGVNRAPGFAFRNLIEVGRFVNWARTQIEAAEEWVEANLVPEPSTTAGLVVGCALLVCCQLGRGQRKR